MSEQSRDMSEIVREYRVILEELKDAQRRHRELRNSIDPENMSIEQEAALFRAQKKLSEVSRRFYYARASYRVDVQRLLVKKGVEQSTPYTNPQVLSDEALTHTIIESEKDMIYRQSWAKTPDFKKNVLDVLQMLREKGKLGPDQLLKLCVCGHTYEEHIKIEGCTKCSVTECESMCTEFELKT